MSNKLNSDSTSTDLDQRPLLKKISELYNNQLKDWHDNWPINTRQAMNEGYIPTDYGPNQGPAKPENVHLVNPFVGELPINSLSDPDNSMSMPRNEWQDVKNTLLPSILNPRDYETSPYEYLSERDSMNRGLLKTDYGPNIPTIPSSLEMNKYLQQKHQQGYVGNIEPYKKEIDREIDLQNYLDNLKLKAKKEAISRLKKLKLKDK